MPELLLRILKHPIDYTGVLNIVDITLKEHYIEDSGVHSFVFTSEKPLTWKAGQHGLFTLPGHPVTGEKWRAFSIASAPHEGIIRISTNIPPEPSSFKQELLKLAPGDTARMFGPFGEFHISPKVEHIVGIAGGIGITPFRSLIANATFQKNPLPITLIYSAQDEHTYKTDLDIWAAENPNLTVIYTHTPDEVGAELDTLVRNHGNSAHYYISGSPGMISALYKTCCDKSIKKSNIVSDPFKGY
jgi:ferredoxin-NADP reductase